MRYSQTFERVDYLLQGQRLTHVFTDHRNLLFVFALLAIEPALGRHVVSKVQRWALYLSRFSYVIEHIGGSANVFADILTRWARGYRNEQKLLRVSRIIVTDAEKMMLSTENLQWPDMQAIRNAQQEERTHVPSGVSFDKRDTLWKRKGLIWIPEAALGLARLGARSG